MSAALIIEQIGRFHFITLHFPIVLISLTPLIMILTCFSVGKFWIPAVPYFIHAAALSALTTATLGLMLSYNRGELPDTLWWHRTFGISAGILILLCSLFLLIRKPDLSKRIPIALWMLVIISAGLTGLAGHLGGEAVHGSLFILGNDF